MNEDSVTPLDENTRRYYLDVMGVQCWQLLDRSAEVAIAASSVADTGSSNEQGTGFHRLDDAIQQCVDCQLHATRKQAITGRGNQSARLMFVLLSPDRDDDASGIMCGGDAGELFAKMLAAIDVSIDDVYITSLLKCSVPAGHTVTSSEISRCQEYLQQQVQLVQPELIIVLGEIATRCMLQQDISLDETRRLINSDVVSSKRATAHQFESVPLFVSYSPQELLQQPGNKRKAWLDLQQLQKLINV